MFCNFRDPSLVTFYFYELTHFLIFTHSTNILVHFFNHKYEKLSHPQKCEDVRPHSSNSIENATPL